MALSVPQQWTGVASNVDAELGTIPTAGNWLVACVAVRVVDGSAPQITVGDPSRNLWHLLHSETVTAHASNDAAELQVQVWVCPAVLYEGWDLLKVLVAAQQITSIDVGRVAVHVAEVAGMVNGYLQVDSVTIGTATAAGSLSLAVPAPAGGANCLVMATAAIDDTTKTVTVTGAGYTGLTQVATSDPDVEMAPAWRAATGATTASWSLAAGTADWAGVAVAIRETGPAPAQPNPNWPALRLDVGFGYDMETPLTAVRWTDQTSRLVERKATPTVTAPRGIPYEMGVAQSEPLDVAIRNDDGAYTPREAGAATASATGTTSTFKCLDADAANINVADFFHLRDSAGDLKELTVFQVTALASAAGTTTVTFARADGTGVALSATASGDQYEGIPVDLFIPFRITAAWDGKVHPITSGWLGELPQTWENPAWGKVAAVGIDALGTLTAGVPTALAGEILRRDPAGYWPLSDPTGAASAVDVSGNGAPALVLTPSKFGTGASSRADFGASTQGVDTGASFPASIAGDPGSGWAQTGLTAAEIPSKGWALVGQGDNFPAISDGVTITGWTLLVDPADTAAIDGSAEEPTVCMIRNADPGAGAEGSVIVLNVAAVTNYASVTRWDASTHAPTTSVASTNAVVNTAFQSWALVFNQTEWHCYVGGVEVLSGSCNLAAGFNLFSVGGQCDLFASGRCLPALQAHVAIYDRMLTLREIQDLDSVGHTGRLVFETKSRLVARKLNTVGWRGPRVIPSSDVSNASEGADGGTAAEFGATAAADDDGIQFLDAAGQLQWRGHVTGYYQSVRAVLGEDEAAGEIPFLPGQKYGFDPTYVYHQVRVENTRLDGFHNPMESTTVATDPESKRRYGPRTMTRDTRLNAPEDAWGLSRALLARYSRTRLRVGQVVIDPASYPTAWAFCLGVETGDLVIVKRRPMGAPVISQTCRVLRVVPSLGPGVATWTLELEAAPDQAIVLGDPVMGSLADRTIGW